MRHVVEEEPVARGAHRDHLRVLHERPPARVARPHDRENEVGDRHERERVRDERERRRVEEDEVVLEARLHEEALEAVLGEELGRADR